MTRDEIKSWLNDWIADAIGIGADDVEEDRTLGSYRLNTLQLEHLSDDIEDFFEEPLESGVVVKRAKVGRVIRELCVLMDTDEEVFGESQPVREPEILHDIGLSGVA